MLAFRQKLYFRQNDRYGTDLILNVHCLKIELNRLPLNRLPLSASGRERAASCFRVVHVCCLNLAP